MDWQPADKTRPAFERRCIRAGPLRSALLLGPVALLLPSRRALPAPAPHRSRCSRGFVHGLLMVPDSVIMLELVLRATVLLSAALALAWLARKGPAGVRHLLWTMTFALLLALPALSLLGPSWELPLLRSPSSAPPQPLPASAPVDVASDGLITLAPPEPPLPGAGSTAAGVEKPLSPTRSIPLPFLVWALGCAAGLASLAMSSLRFAGLVRAAHPLGDPIRLQRAKEVRQRLGIRSDVRLFLSPAATTPMTGGLWKPVVLLPGSARAWSPERWDIVLTHEMIHVRRRDVLRQLMARAVIALYWFHPLSWVAARLAAFASEEACDEEVLALGSRPSQYATHLLSLAGGMTAQRPVLSLSMGQRPHSQLERRIMTILEPHRPPRNVAATALMVMAISGVGVSAAVAHPVRSQSSDTIVRGRRCADRQYGSGRRSRRVHLRRRNIRGCRSAREDLRRRPPLAVGSGLRARWRVHGLDRAGG